MQTTKHNLAMAHYDSCSADAWDDIKTAMVEMRPLYDAAPDLLSALEDIVDSESASPMHIRAMAAIKAAKGE